MDPDGHGSSTPAAGPWAPGLLEDLGRRLARAVAAEFARRSETCDHPDGATHDELVGSARSNDVVGEMLDWIDLAADLARDAVRSVADLADASLRAPEQSLHLESTCGAGDTLTGEFWLHSARGAAQRVSPRAEALRSDREHDLPVTIDPASGDVAEGTPARFRIRIDGLATAPPGDYWGTIEAPEARHGLPVRLRLTR